MLFRSLKNRIKGNISIFALVLVVMFSFLLLLVFDLCKIFVVREITKRASDSAALSSAQNLIFFEDINLDYIAKKIAEENGCRLVKCKASYDEVIVVVEKDINFLLVSYFIPLGDKVQSVSKVKVIYPWDSRFGFCKSYKFEY